MTDGPGRPFALSAAQERLVGEVRALAREVLDPLAAAGRPGRACGDCGHRFLRGSRANVRTA